MTLLTDCVDCGGKIFGHALFLICRGCDVIIDIGAFAYFANDGYINFIVGKLTS